MIKAQDTQEIVARRYAKAFINVFGNTMTIDELHAIKAFEQFVNEHKRLLVFFMLSQIDDATKQQQLDAMLDSFKLKKLFHPLSQLLLKSKRVFLLPRILKQIAVLYKQAKKIIECTITSSHELNAQALSTIQNFLARKTGCAIIYTNRVDKNLIAGLRLQGDTVLWEYSIRKQLRQVALARTH
ncbi:MAG TPA: ATP synthase F1 subunit delta [Candidatus Babeliales bacterium]|nr:ATP synthase F1 subunit delta [Candidatus Babeliales bacterium]